MKRIYNFILLVCLVQLAVAQNRIAEIRENLLGNYSDRVGRFSSCRLAKCSRKFIARNTELH